MLCYPQKYGAVDVEDYVDNDEKVKDFQLKVKKKMNREKEEIWDA
jgi:hypothetical protein